MTDRMINEEITHLVRHLDPVRGKIFWRSFADEVHAAPLNWLNGVRVDDHDDRVGMYWSTWIADIKDCPVAFEERIDTKQDKGLIANLWTGFKIVIFPFLKPLLASTLSVSGHAKKMEAFYKYQKEGYDTFREGLLHARPSLMEAFPLLKEGNMVWADVGGGTARNLEFFTPEIIRKYFKKIYIVDISASLLEIAQRRITAMGLDDIAQVVEFDVTNTEMINLLGGEGSLDVVTMSYSYSMIPDQKATLRNVHKLLKKDGYMAIADFFLKGNYDDCLSPLWRTLRSMESFFQKCWFAMDAVHLLNDSQLESEEDFDLVWDNRFRGSVPFLPFLQPYHGVRIVQKK